ncbi:MAG: hypothetical protein K2M31_06550 [Muribaculaceae bacterium]|nr:hypothetical protein [Muribaculaceae bacterium]
MELPPPYRNQPTSAVSWLGLGLSILLLLIIWIVNILVFGDKGYEINILLIPVVFVEGLIGILAMTFSVVGLFMAVRKSTPRWIGVTGIILCVASILSFILPFVYLGMSKRYHSETPAIETTLDSSDECEHDITIQIFNLGRVRCINNKESKSSVVGNMKTSDGNFDRNFANWLKTNKGYSY